MQPTISLLPYNCAFANFNNKLIAASNESKIGTIINLVVA